MILRPFSPQDAPIVSDIIITNLHAYYANAWDVEDYSSMHRPKKLIQMAEKENIYVVESDGQIIATGSLKDNEIKDVFVLISEQSKGIGKWLVTQLERILKDKRYIKSFLFSGKYAVGFYEKMGYKQTGKVLSKGEDIEMEKLL
jgi:citrate lyase synthetase